MERPVSVTRDVFDDVTPTGTVRITTTTFTCTAGRSRAPRQVIPSQPRLRPLTGQRPVAELLADEPPLVEVAK
ncbi:MAG: hypothetical protein K2W95_36645 [Candidatus Obscuribacterales bacterium]|nr:hypothetical protein [Candidatus Obscuribacterales bacterium]